MGLLLKPITWPLGLLFRLVKKLVRFAAISVLIGAVLMVLDTVLLQDKRRRE
ncbi:MAG: hypothetical protein ACKVVT_02820 [Dehalococcoidia bacterium]